MPLVELQFVGSYGLALQIILARVGLRGYANTHMQALTKVDARLPQASNIRGCVESIQSIASCSWTHTRRYTRQILHDRNKYITFQTQQSPHLPTCSCGVVALPIQATLCSNSPNTHPIPHISMASVYPPLLITTSGAR